jgi:CHAT domain-containing protein
LVLPACDSGQLTAVGSDDLLGLATALLPLGTAGIVASLLPVDDAATVAVMLEMHEGLRAGATLAAALHRGRRAVDDDPVHRATACSFVAIGPA